MSRAIAVAVNGFMFGALLMSLFLFFCQQEVQQFITEVHVASVQIQTAVENVSEIITALKSGSYLG